MPSNIQSAMTSLTWHNAIPTWQVLSYFVISRNCTRTPKSRNYSSPPSHQTQYRADRPKFVATWLTAPYWGGLGEELQLYTSSVITIFGLIRGKITSRCWISPVAVLFTDYHRRREMFASSRLYLLLPLIGSCCYTMAITTLSLILVTMGLLWLWPRERQVAMMLW
mgnify:CR=1 FL=1